MNDQTRSNRFSKRHWVAGYFLLLLASHGVRWLTPLQTPANRQVLSIPVLEQPLVYRDLGPPDQPNGPVLLALHSNPASHPSLEPLLSHLAEDYRIIVPDLPGFGGTPAGDGERGLIPHAQYVIRLLDELGVSRVHGLGVGYGGNVAMAMGQAQPERLASLTLVSSPGVLEHHLFGDQLLNRAVAGSLYALLWLAQEGFPHFGWMDRFPWNLHFAAVYFDRDLESMRSWMNGYSGPVLLVHGIEDRRVPLEAAREHRRLMPQSESLFLSGDHAVAEEEAGFIAEGIGQFLQRVEGGKGTRRPQADPNRVAASEKPPSPRSPVSGMALFFMVLLLAMAIQTSEDLTCIGAGVLVSQGFLGFLPATLGCIIGIVLGDIGLYLAGRYLGQPALKKAPLRWFLPEKKILRGAKKFNRQGFRVIFASRFLPGARVPMYFTAGTLGMGFFRFSAYLTIAALVWTPMLVGIATWLGSNMMVWFKANEAWALWGLVGIVLTLWLLINTGLPLLTKSGRRHFVTRWRRRGKLWVSWLSRPWFSNLRRSLLQAMVHDRSDHQVKSAIQSVSQKRTDQNYRKAAQYTSRKTVLDIGPGYGLGYNHLLESDPKRIVCMDPFDQAEKKFLYRDPRIVFFAQDFLKNNFEGESFDVVLCLAAIYYIPDTERLLSEVARILKPGGAFVVNHFDAHVMRWIFGATLPDLDKRYAEVPGAGAFSDQLKRHFGSEPECYVQSPVVVTPFWRLPFSLLSLPLRLVTTQPRLIPKTQKIKGVYNFCVTRSK